MVTPMTPHHLSAPLKSLAVAVILAPTLQLTVSFHGLSYQLLSQPGFCIWRMPFFDMPPWFGAVTSTGDPLFLYLWSQSPRVGKNVCASSLEAMLKPEWEWSSTPLLRSWCTCFIFTGSLSTTLLKLWKWSLQFSSYLWSWLSSLFCFPSLQWPSCSPWLLQIWAMIGFVVVADLGMWRCGPLTAELFLMSHGLLSLCLCLVLGG